MQQNTVISSVVCRSFGGDLVVVIWGVSCVLFPARFAGEKRHCERMCDRRYVEWGHRCLHLWDRQHFTPGHTQYLCVSGCWWCRSCHVSKLATFWLFQLCDKIRHVYKANFVGILQDFPWKERSIHNLFELQKRLICVSLWNCPGTHVLMQYVTVD